MHVTQRNVIAKLMYADALRYAEIKPAEMTGNQFSYHLTALKKDGYVEKNDQGLYRLTLKGKQLTDRLSMKTMKRTVQPKLVVMALLLREDGAALFHLRHRQPFSGFWNIIYAKVRFDEHPSETLRRIIDGRHKLSDIAFYKPHFVSLKILNSQSELISHLMAYVYIAKTRLPQNYEPKNDHYRFAAAEELQTGYWFPGMQELLTLRGDGSNMIELTVTATEPETADY